MKKILFFGCVSIFTIACNSAEINLNCSGVESFYSSSRGMNEKLDATIEVKFDDSTNKLLYASPSRLFGCYGDESDYKRTCNCNITESMIICTSESSSNSKDFNSKQTVNVNRFTGILKFSEVTSGGRLGDRYYMYRSGDLKCEYFSKKKF